ncbi:phage portal protein [Amycolatopsis kentuckyensis]|uniref:phage portal protein n=1 Tax=Amycolatopsis kentuckyensis TaxID=218823 RepID=UPI000A3875E7|nr:phage portal protein [Amycolatopsis kentuckyensis]
MSLFGLFESRDSIENPQVPITSASLLDLFGGQIVEAGVAVTPESSLEMSAVFRATTLISSVAAAMPLVTYKEGTKTPQKSPLLRDPHPEMTPFELWQLSYAHRCLWGNFYAQKVKARNGQVKYLYPLSPWNVKVGRVKPSELNPSGKVFAIAKEDGSTEPATSREIFHIPGFGYDGLTGVSRVRLAAQGIGTALAAERYSGKLFGSGNLMSGILQTEQRLQPEQAEAIQSRWKAKVSGLARAHETVVLDAGAKFQQLTMPSADAELLASRHFEVIEIARYFGVPPYLMMETEKTTSWGTGLEQQSLGFVTFDLHPQWLAPTEQRITKELTGPTTEVKYDLDMLIRGDTAARTAFYSMMRQVGAFSANDIRDRENLPPIADGNSYLQPANMQPLGFVPPPDGGNNGSSQPAGD